MNDNLVWWWIAVIALGILSAVLAGSAYSNAAHDCRERGGVLVRGLGRVPACVAAPTGGAR